MKPYYKDNHVTQYCIDFRENDLPDECAQMVCTSPPYWGQRKYAGEQELIWGGDKNCGHQWGGQIIVKHGHAGNKSTLTGTQTAELSKRANAHGTSCCLCGAWKGALGMEPTPEMYIEHSIEILQEVRRILRKDGIVFWNIGDSYAGSGSPGGDFRNGKGGDDYLRPYNRKGGALKPKDLCLMPESVTDRPTESHEYILMLTKSARYYWDAEAVRERAIRDWVDCGGSLLGKTGWASKVGRNDDTRAEGTNADTLGRNLRSVWTFPTMPGPSGKVRNFAVFPEKLPELCIKAATPEVGCCNECGAPWERILEKGFTDHGGDTDSDYPEGTTAKRLALLRQAAREQGSEYINTSKTIGWQPTCKCDAPRVPSIVSDPFAGSGTTLWVAKKLNRYAVGFDTAEEYCQLTVERCRQQVLL